MIKRCRSCDNEVISDNTSYLWLCPQCAKNILKIDVSTEMLLEELERRSKHPFTLFLVKLLLKWIGEIE